MARVSGTFSTGCSQKTMVRTTLSLRAHSRRDVLQSTLGTFAVLANLAAAGGPAEARQQPLNKEVDAAESPYIQELLRRSQEKKEQRQKERLDAYNKKVFKEYFEFEGGNPRAGAARGIKPETEAAIQQWLKDNQ